MEHERNMARIENPARNLTFRSPVTLWAATSVRTALTLTAAVILFAIVRDALWEMDQRSIVNAAIATIVALIYVTSIWRLRLLD
jgi:hypothetical protein